MIKKILFFLCLLLVIRSIYYLLKLITFQLKNLSDYGEGAFLGHLILSIFLLTSAFFLGRNIWFRNKGN